MTPTTRRPRTRIALVGLAIAAVVAAILPAQRAAADHTPLPDTVTLVGSLQSELGCPGDWQPECDATHLQPVAGEPGVFRGTFTVPAGGFEYKVAINESFDENYGAGGAPGGANIPITAPGGEVTFTYDHATHLISDDLPRSITADRAAHWVRRDLIAWNLPDAREGFHYRIYWDPDGGHDRRRRRDQCGVMGGDRTRAGRTAGCGAAAVPPPGRLRGPAPAAQPGQQHPVHPDRPGGGRDLRRRRRAGLRHRRADSRRLGRHLLRCPAARTSGRPGTGSSRRWRSGRRPRRRSPCCWTGPVPHRSAGS